MRGSTARSARQCSQRCRLSDPTDADDGYESAHRGATAHTDSLLRRRRVWAHRDRTARSAQLAGRTRAGGGGLCRRAHYIVHTYRKRASYLQSRRSTCICKSPVPLRGRVRSPAATFERLHSRVQFTSTTRTAVLRDRRASACSLAAFRTEMASLASIAQAPPATIVTLTSRSQCAPCWRRCLRAG